MPRLIQGFRHPDDIVAPVLTAVGRYTVQLKLELARKVLRAYYQLAVSTGSRRDPGEKSNGRRHYESIVIVGVFPNQIDASRRLVHPRNVLEHGREGLAQLVHHVFG